MTPSRATKERRWTLSSGKQHPVSDRTDLLQPLDLSVNKPLKDHLRIAFNLAIYSDQVSKQQQEGKASEDIKVDTKLSIMKPFSASQKFSTVHGFLAAGIAEVLESDVVEDDTDTSNSDEDPFQDLARLTSFANNEYCV